MIRALCVEDLEICDRDGRRALTREDTESFPLDGLAETPNGGPT